METFPTVLYGVIPVFAIVGAGFGVRRLKWLTREADESLLRLTINVLMPCLILDSVLGNPAMGQWHNLVLPPLLGFGFVVGGVLIARACAGLAGIREARAQRTFGLAVGLQNYGYLPLPLAMLLFDQETVGVLFVFCVGVDVALWTVGMMTLTGAGLMQGWRRIINAPLIAITLAVTLNLMGWGESLPGWTAATLHLLAQCAMPLALLLIGATIDDHLEEFQFTANWRLILVAIGLRLAVIPFLFLSLAQFVPLSPELRQVSVLEAAMPSAVFPIVMAKHYGGDTPTALRVVMGTSVAGLLTIPLWIQFGTAWLGL